MDKAVYDQITNLLEKSQKILLLTHARADCDGLGAALASYLALKELGKEVTVATNDPAPENLGFLPSIDILQNSLAGATDFIITLDSTKTPIGKIKYNVEDNRVNIIITPKNGSFSESDVSFQHGKKKFDLIFVLDTGNLEHLGPIYDRNVEMFFETPVINIDHHSSNTDFGQVNLVSSTASSTTEILYEYLAYLEKKYDKKLITEDIATLLLAGIITDTGSFQHANTSPRAMETASQLLDLGGRQQEIIKNIYKTKKLSTLKIWGIVLSKVQVDPVYRMVWSTINKEDLQEADANPEETEGIIDDLLTNAPGAEVIFLVKQNPEYVSVSMRSTSSAIDVGKFCAENGGGGHARAAGFKVHSGRPFDQIMSDVIAKVRKFQAERLNIHEEDLEKPMGAPVGAPIEAPTAEKKQPDKPKPETPSAVQTPPTTEPSSAKATEVPKKTEEKPTKPTYLDFQAPKSPVKQEKPVPEKPKEVPAPPIAKPTPIPPTPESDDGNRHPEKKMEEKPEQPKKRKRPRRRRPRPKKQVSGTGTATGTPPPAPPQQASQSAPREAAAPQPAPPPMQPEPPLPPPPPFIEPV